MQLSIVAKMLGFLIVGSGITSVITMSVIYQKSIVKLSNDEKNNIFIYAISQNVGKSITNKSSGNIEKSDYHCKFGNIKFECELTTSSAFDSNNQWNIGQATNNTNTNITAEQLRSSGNVYKIKINKSIKDWTNNYEFSVIPRTDSEQKYAKLKPIFAINSNNQVDQYTKTQYVLVETQTTTQNNKPHTCTTSDTPTPKDECVIHKFTDAQDTSNTKKWNAVRFKKSEISANNSLAQQKYYLVQLNKDVKVKSIDNIKITTTSGDDVVTNTQIPVIYDAQKPNNIFILSKPTQ